MNGVYLEEGHAGAAVNGAVLDGRLVSQVIYGFNGDIHPLHGEEGCKIGCVGGDDDQGERPPRERGSKDGDLRFSHGLNLASIRFCPEKIHREALL